MNIAARNELMQVLTELSRLQPYIRLGQLVAILTDKADVPYRNPIPDIEDEELLPAAKNYLATLRQLPPDYLEQQTRAHLESDAAAGPIKAS
jgi:hypothetical protein